MNARRCICPRRRRLKWLKPSTSRQGDEQTIGPKCCDPMSENWVKTGKAQGEHMFSALAPKDGVIGRPSLWIAEDFGCCASG
jgi:hypothetical protein